MTQPGEGVSNQLEKRGGTIAVLYAGFMYDARDQKTRGVREKMPFAPFNLLASVEPARAPASVVLTDWLSITPAVGLASRPSASRAIMTRW